ncbi:MAG: hypothetical protein LBP53_05995 [Candidatus Peribacteria bacterium]|jgi:hypothetical protein|nr:hypothetical protein [Candidatus Peribacteria bacterium]
MSSLKKFLLSRPGRFLLTIYRYLVQFGFIPLHFLGAIKNIGWYIRDSIHIKKAKLTEFKITFNHPCLHDKEEDGGTAK